MEIERTKLLAKKSLLRSIILVVLCSPLLFGAILKLFYYLPVDPSPMSGGFIKGLKGLVSRLYNGFEPIQWIWPVSPTPTVEQVLTFGNSMTMALFVGALWGIFSFQFSIAKVDELSEAKRKARQRKLEDEYGKKN